MIGPPMRPGLLGQGVAERADRRRGDRLDQDLPDVGGADDPLGPAPGGGRGHAGGERRWSRRASGRRAGRRRRPRPAASGTGVGSGCWADGLAGQCRWRRPSSAGRRSGCIIDWSWLNELRSGSPPPGEPPSRAKNCSNGVPRNGFWSSGSSGSSGMLPGLSRHAVQRVRGRPATGGRTRLGSARDPTRRASRRAPRRPARDAARRRRGRSPRSTTTPPAA